MRRGRDASPAVEEVQPSTADDEAEHSVEEGEDEDDEEEEEEGEDEEGAGEEEGDEVSEAEEVDDEDPTADEEEEQGQDQSYAEGGDEEEGEGGDEGEGEEGNQGLDQSGAAEESFIDSEEGEEEEEEEAPSAPPPPPFTFSSLPSSSSSFSSSTFPSFSIGSGGSSLPPSSSLPPFSFSASTSSSSAPFTFPGSTTFSVGQNATSSTTSAPFTFASSASAPSPAPPPVPAPAPAFTRSTGAPFTFSSSSASAPSSGSQSTSTPSFLSSSFLSPFSSTSAASPTLPSSAPTASSTPSISTSAPTSSAAGASGGVIAVPVTARGVSGVWGGCGELLLYPNAESNKSTSHGRNHQHPPFHGSDIFRFQWPTPYGEMTTLLHSWHAVFLHVQQQARVQATKGKRHAVMQEEAAVLSPIQWREFLLTQSHCYRAELDACLYRAAQSLSSVSTRQDLTRHRVSSDEYHAHLLLLESAASTWHLFELVCLDPHDNLTVQLVDWLQRSTAAPHTQGLQMDSDEWWTALLHLLVQGRLTAVVDLLSSAMTSSSSPFSLLPSAAATQLMDLLQTLPSLTAHATSVYHLVSLIRDYQMAVQHLAASTSAFQSHPYLPALLSILTGDEAALTAVCDDWMQLLVAHLIFVQPQTSKQDLPDLVHRCEEAMKAKEREEGGTERVTVPLLAQLRQHVLCFRVHSAVLLADQVFELPVFTAHLVDLLHVAGVMPTLRQAEKPLGRHSGQQKAAVNEVVGVGEMTPRDWYLWQYVLSLQHHDRLWTLTLDYIQAIGVGAPTPPNSTPPFSPIHALCSLLLNQRCDCSTQLLQLLQLCSTHQLPAFVPERLCERFAQSMLREGQTGAAVYWYERGGDSGKRRIREIAIRILDRLIVGGREDRNNEMSDGDHHRGSSHRSIEEDEAAMEALLDNVSEQWLHEESGCVEVILLQQWRDYSFIRRQLGEIRHPQSNGSRGAAAPLNLFQQQRGPTSLSGDDMLDDGVDGLMGADDRRLALTQSGVALLISLLTEPLVHPPHGALLYTPQSLHLPLLRELSGLLLSLDASSVSAIAECSVGGIQGVLNALNRCELSWRWGEWRRRARLGVKEVQDVRTVLLSCMQSALLMEESAKRVNVRV